MHMRGEPGTMQRAPEYADVVGEVEAHLAARHAAAARAGVAPERVLLDPGIGFGKTLDHNLALLSALERFTALGPVLLGASRKSFLGALTGRLPHERVIGSLACVARATQAGVAAVRVHDVNETREMLAVLGRIGPMNK
jgi:dihydropteroate synthase